MVNWKKNAFGLLYLENRNDNATFILKPLFTPNKKIIKTTKEEGRAWNVTKGHAVEDLRKFTCDLSIKFTLMDN